MCSREAVGIGLNCWEGVLESDFKFRSHSKKASRGWVVMQAGNTALRELRQENHVLDANPGYTMRPRLGRVGERGGEREKKKRMDGTWDSILGQN